MSKSANELATEIASGLFHDGSGKLADRLEIKYKNTDGTERGSGGWCQAAVINHIEAKLKENLFWSLE